MEGKKNTPPLSTIYLYITENCNQNCVHCWVNPQTKYNYGTTKKQYNFLKEFKKTFLDAMKLGLKKIKITGGEPFLFSELFDLLDWLREKNIFVSIESNGTLIDKDEAEFLKHFGVRRVSVSLDGPEEIHDSIRNSKGAFDSTTKAIKKLVAAEINVEVIMSIYKKNAKFLSGVVELCDELNVNALKINPIISVGRSKLLKENNELLSIEEILQMFKSFVLKSKFKVPIYFDIPPVFYPLSYLKTRLCTCNICNLLGILADGRVSICGIGYTTDLVLGNIKSDSILKLWQNNEILKEIREKIPSGLQGICKKCILKFYCLGKCRALAYSNYKSLYAPLPFCQEAYERGIFPSSKLIY